MRQSDFADVVVEDGARPLGDLGQPGDAIERAQTRLGVRAARAVRNDGLAARPLHQPDYRFDHRRVSRHRVLRFAPGQQVNFQQDPLPRPDEPFNAAEPHHSLLHGRLHALALIFIAVASRDAHRNARHIRPSPAPAPDRR